MFIAQLAEGLQDSGIDVVVYSNGESRVGVETRWLYKNQQWPIKGEIFDNLKDFNHPPGPSPTQPVTATSSICTMFPDSCSRALWIASSSTPSITFEPPLSEIYNFFPEVEYITISDFQRQRESLPRGRTIHHGIDLNLYRLQSRKQNYLSFLGRIAPIKGTHLAIEVAKKSGIPLKIAGEVQPIFQSYFDSRIKPHIDGKFIEYVGEADLATKNELLGNSTGHAVSYSMERAFRAGDD